MDSGIEILFVWARDINLFANYSGLTERQASANDGTMLCVGYFPYWLLLVSFWWHCNMINFHPLLHYFGPYKL